MKTKLLLFIAVFILLTNNQVYSQIIYTDVDPDVTISNFQQGYGIDFDDNDKIDFHITLLSNVDVWVMHLILDSSIDNTYVVYDGTEASVLEFGDEISTSSNLYHLGGSDWGGLLFGYWVSAGEHGNWVDTQEDKYLGIKFEIDGEFHYGWVRLTTIIHSNSDMEFTVKDFAYNTVLDEGILAGAMGTAGVNDTVILDISVYPNPTSDILYFKGIKNITQITIYDVTGNAHQDASINYATNSIDLSNLNSGVFFIQFQTDNTILVKKIIKE